MGQHHPSFSDIAFFVNYAYSHNFVDDHLGRIHVFHSRTDKTDVYVQELDRDLLHEQVFEIANDKYDYHHPFLLHIFNYIVVRGETMNQAMGKNFSDDFFGREDHIGLIIMEAFQSDLSSDIRKRSHNKRPFTETELWDMADQMIKALAYLQLQGVPHKSVSITKMLNCNGVYKMNYVQPVINAAVYKKDIWGSNYKKDLKALGLALLTATNLGTPGLDLSDNILHAGRSYS